MADAQALNSFATTEMVQPSVVSMRYYKLTKNWPKIRPHLADEKLNRIIRRDFEKFVRGRWDKEMLAEQFPGDFAFWWRQGKKGRRPQWWRYVSAGACHWLVNTALRMATLVEPKRPWRVITSDIHSTVWDGGDTLFEFNYQAFGVPADECFASATDPDAHPRELRPGKERKVDLAEHYSVERKLDRVPANDNKPPVAVAA
jgi:hypothetical protein